MLIIHYSFLIEFLCGLSEILLRKIAKHRDFYILPLASSTLRLPTMSSRLSSFVPFYHIFFQKFHEKGCGSSEDRSLSIFALYVDISHLPQQYHLSRLHDSAIPDQARRILAAGDLWRKVKGSKLEGSRWTK